MHQRIFGEIRLQLFQDGMMNYYFPAHQHTEQWNNYAYKEEIKAILVSHTFECF